METLYVDGNNLNNLDGLSQAYFPELQSLGISDNKFNFTCDYFSLFMKSWRHLRLVRNTPITPYHVDGIDCNPTSNKQIDYTTTASDVSKIPLEHHVIDTHVHYYVRDNQIFVYLQSFICIMCFAYFLVKLVKYLYLRRISYATANEQNIIYRNEDVNICLKN